MSTAARIRLSAGDSQTSVGVRRVIAALVCGMVAACRYDAGPIQRRSPPICPILPARSSIVATTCDEEAWGTGGYRGRHIPGAVYAEPRSRPLGRQNGQQRTSSAARSCEPGADVRPARHRERRAGGRLQSGQRHVRQPAVVAAALAGARAAWRCSTAGSRNGQAKQRPLRSGIRRGRRATSTAPRMPGGR